jgi:hypothetical protein
MIEIGRKDDSWQKPACAHSAHRRGIVYLLKHGLETRVEDEKVMLTGMTGENDETNYFHLSGAMLAPGSIIEPGNWGRMIRALSWQHNCAMREAALEIAREDNAPSAPSRLEAAFVMLTEGEARFFQQHTNGFQNHLLYRVALVDPAAKSHIADSRLCGPVGNFRNNWANVYWLPYDAQGSAIPGLDWAIATAGVQ